MLSCPASFHARRWAVAKVRRGQNSPIESVAQASVIHRTIVSRGRAISFVRWSRRRHGDCRRLRRPLQQCEPFADLAPWRDARRRCSTHALYGPFRRLAGDPRNLLRSAVLAASDRPGESCCRRSAIGKRPGARAGCRCTASGRSSNYGVFRASQHHQAIRVKISKSAGCRRRTSSGPR